jgi:hypothetical protein
MAHMGEKRNAHGTLDEEAEPNSPLQKVVSPKSGRCFLEKIK